MKGFTLVETLVAIVILTLTIVGPFQVAQGVLSQAYSARDQLLAAGLAQEAVEYVREIRDSNYLYNTHHGPTVNWLSGVDGTNGPNCYTFACAIDTSQYPSTAPFSSLSAPISVISCGDATCASMPLLLSGTNLYNQTSGTTTPYVRKVQLTAISSTETNVMVTVTWTNHGTHTVILTEDLQNWL